MPLPRVNFLIMLFSAALLLAAIDAHALPIYERSSLLTDGFLGGGNDAGVIRLVEETETGQALVLPSFEEHRAEVRFERRSLGDYRFEGHSFRLTRSQPVKLSR